MTSATNGSGTAPGVGRSRLSNAPTATDVENATTGDKGTTRDTTLTGHIGRWERGLFHYSLPDDALDEGKVERWAMGEEAFFEEWIVDDPDYAGNRLAHCPHPDHEDRNPSASVNLVKGVWFCQSCNEGGSTAAFLWNFEGDWSDEPIVGEGATGGFEMTKAERAQQRRERRNRQMPVPSRLKIGGWNGYLLSHPEQLEYLEARGISTETVREYRLGYDTDPRDPKYTIPVFDADGETPLNVRFNRPGHADKKYSGVTGHNEARLFPLPQFLQTGSDEVVITEGEWDCLLLRQHGFNALTMTSGVGGLERWKSEWNDVLIERGIATVYLVPDCDGEGKRGAQKASSRMRAAGLKVATVVLPYDEGTKADVTDFWRDRGDAFAAEMRARMDRAGDRAPDPTPPADPESPFDGPVGFDGEVAEAAHRLRVREAARDLVARERALASWTPPESEMTLADELALDLPPLTWTVEGLHFTGANTLLAASFKSGKTTLSLNLFRSLIDGTRFLGQFDVEPPAGRVAFWNYELDQRQFDDWVRDLDISALDRGAVQHLRGARVPLMTDVGKEWTVEWLRKREVSAWIVDPLARAFGGENENDNGEMGPWLERLDEIKAEAGVEDLFLIAHTGRGEQVEGQERVRGATRLDDWADVRWILVKEKDGARYFGANGRDVDVAQAALTYDRATRTLGWTTTTRKEAQQKAKSETTERRVQQLVEIVAANPGIGTNALKGECSFSDRDFPKARDTALERGEVRIEEGPNRSKMFFLVESDRRVKRGDSDEKEGR